MPPDVVKEKDQEISQWEAGENTWVHRDGVTCIKTVQMFLYHTELNTIILKDFIGCKGKLQ